MMTWACITYLSCTCETHCVHAARTHLNNRIRDVNVGKTCSLHDVLPQAKLADITHTTCQNNTLSRTV